MSYDNTDHPPITVINDLLQCILQFLLALIGHLGDLGLDAVFYDLFNGFAEDIGIPDAFFTVFGTGFYVCDQGTKLKNPMQACLQEDFRAWDPVAYA